MFLTLNKRPQHNRNSLINIIIIDFISQMHFSMSLSKINKNFFLEFRIFKIKFNLKKNIIFVFSESFLIFILFILQMNYLFK
jgi:hypothetical protein